MALKGKAILSVQQTGGHEVQLTWEGVLEAVWPSAGLRQWTRKEDRPLKGRAERSLDIRLRIRAGPPSSPS